MNLFFASISKKNTKPILVIINGESNSGGYALNSEAPLNEIGVRDSVQILNNNTLIFEDLNIGVNNLIGHSGLSNGVTHGFELELANRADTLSGIYQNGVYLIKTGAGGSMISQWSVGDTFFTTFQNRITAAKSLLDFTQYNIVLLFSLGINDAISNTNVNTWKSGVVAHFQNMRDEIGQGDIPIIMTEFEGMGSPSTAYNTYSATIQNIAIEGTNIYSVDVTGAGLRDANHWNYSGMKQVAGSMLDVYENIL